MPYNMNKFINDIFKEDGKWSKKSIYTVISLNIALLLGVFIVISDKVLTKVVNPYAIQVFDSLLIFGGSLLSVIVASKVFGNKLEKPKDE